LIKIDNLKGTKGGDLMPKIVTGISFDDHILKETKRLAKLDGRPLSNYINRVLEKNIREVGGNLPPEEEEPKTPPTKMRSLLRRRR
jgi:hypothetical protein